jgi:hypothetical protein
LQLRGDVLGARNWIEKSLIVAPDFKAAQRQLASLVRRSTVCRGCRKGHGAEAAAAAADFEPGMIQRDERTRHAAIVVRDS